MTRGPIMDQPENSGPWSLSPEYHLVADHTCPACGWEWDEGEAERHGPGCRLTPHRYVPTGVSHHRTCDICAQGANASIHRSTNP